MRRSISAGLIALATIALGLMPILASADEGAFKAQLTPYSAIVINPSEVLGYLAGNGTDLGTCTAVATTQYSEDYSAGWGPVVLTAANGDLLNLDFAATLNPDRTAWVGTYTITGGTGRFLNASGTGNLDVIINYTSPPTWRFDGCILAPAAT